MKAYLETSEIQRLEQAATNLRDKLLVRLLFHLGCRISEALTLTVNDIDFNRGIVTIHHLKSRIKISCPQCNNGLGKAHTYCPKCGAIVAEAIKKEQDLQKLRALPLDDGTLDMLKDYIKRGGPINNGGKLLIFGINRHRAWQIIHTCAAKAGLDDLANPTTGRKCGVSPHRLRDAFAVHAMKTNDSGDSLRMLQVHLGHASFNTTAKYRKVSGEEHRNWYRKLWGDIENGG